MGLDCGRRRDCNLFKGAKTRLFQLLAFLESADIASGYFYV
jgi:hypothetical protein